MSTPSSAASVAPPHSHAPPSPRPLTTKQTEPTGYMKAGEFVLLLLPHILSYVDALTLSNPHSLGCLDSLSLSPNVHSFCKRIKLTPLERGHAFPFPNREELKLKCQGCLSNDFPVTMVKPPPQSFLWSTFTCVSLRKK